VALTVAFVTLALAVAYGQASGTKQEPARSDEKPATANEQAGGEKAKPAEHRSEAGGSTTEKELAEASEEAAGEENAEFKESPSVRWIAGWTGMSPRATYWVLYILDFGIIAGLIVWFSKSKLPAAFRGRTQSIQRSMQEAQKASAEANARLSAIEDRLERLDAEIAHMRAAADQDASAEDERIRAAAEEEKRKIIAAAEQEITAAANLARRELKAYTADLAVKIAARNIRLDPAEDKALVRDFAAQLKDGQ
jgi:F-type H+-transporting ATPase subunit b